MYRIRKSIDVDFSHHVRGHLGPCINLHGHTWKLEVALEANALDAQGFVVDFGDLKRQVLSPCHSLLDHGLAVGEATYREIFGELQELGQRLLASRQLVHGAESGGEGAGDGVDGSSEEAAEAVANRPGPRSSPGASTESMRPTAVTPLIPPDPGLRLNGARQVFPGGLKVAVFPFNPTSERLAEWLYGLARAELEDDRVRVAYARVYETLHPVEAIAEFLP